MGAKWAGAGEDMGTQDATCTCGYLAVVVLLLQKDLGFSELQTRALTVARDVYILTAHVKLRRPTTPTAYLSPALNPKPRP